MATANERLLERAVRHSLFLVRLRNGQAREQTALLESLLLDKVLDRYTRDIGKVKSRGLSVSLRNSKRLRDMMQWVSKVSGEEYRALASAFKESLRRWFALRTLSFLRFPIASKVSF